MAHQPWLVKSKVNIGDLVTSGAENWSLNELVHAMLIMAHFHSLACFVFGCGIVPEIDFIRDKLDGDDGEDGNDGNDDSGDGGGAGGGDVDGAGDVDGGNATAAEAASSAPAGGSAPAGDGEGDGAAGGAAGGVGEDDVAESVSAFGATLAKLKERLAMGEKEETKEANLYGRSTYINTRGPLMVWYFAHPSKGGTEHPTSVLSLAHIHEIALSFVEFMLTYAIPMTHHNTGKTLPRQTLISRPQRARSSKQSRLDPLQSTAINAAKMARMARQAAVAGAAIRS